LDVLSFPAVSYIESQSARLSLTPPLLRLTHDISVHSLSNLLVSLLKRGQLKGEFEPMSEKLYTRMKAVLNAELSAVLSIPLLATFMARGVWYSNDFPWPAGLVWVLLVSGGASFFYGKQAVTWTDVND
jgi:hypothetical protein